MNPTFLLAGKLAGTAALATGALLTGVQAVHSDTTPTPSAQKTTQKCGTGHADPQLRAALKAARQKPAGTERRQALRAVHKNVRKGQYGDQATIRQLRGEVRGLRLLAKAPDALKADLKAARAKPAGTERKQARAQVWKDAAAGKYGDDVKKVATKAEQRKDRRQEHRQACRATRKQTS